MKPNYKHDCDNCKFLGSASIKGVTYDMYYCASEPTIIARFSDEGGDYTSGICFGETGLAYAIHGSDKFNKPLSVAYVMAMANGYDVSDKYSDVTLVEKIEQAGKTIIREKMFESAK